MRRASTTGLLALLCAGTPATVFSQDCALSVQPTSGASAYRARSYGCEGFYVQLQSASINVQVLSLIKGVLDLGDHESLLISIPKLPVTLRDTVRVFGFGLEPGLNWALDGRAQATKPMSWQLSAVVRPEKLKASSIGLVSRAQQRIGIGAPVYVAVRVSPLANGSAGLTSTASNAVPTKLVVRIPLAGGVKWRLASERDWHDTTGDLDGDGRFDVELPAGLTGEVTVELKWRARSSQTFGAPESLTLLLW